MTIKKHANRKPKKTKVRKNLNSEGRGTSRSRQGELMIMEDNVTSSENFKLDWFKPTMAQKDIIISMCTNDLTVVQGSSGCGKSTTAIYQGLADLKRGLYKKMYFIKTPSEDGEDPIGFLKGSSSEKLTVHFDAMKTIFYTFMTKAKLEMEEKREHIEFTIPNFIAGKTLSGAIIIIDEAQKISPDTMKLLLERVGKDSKVVLLGDKYQRYAAKKREDGLSDFVSKITYSEEEGNKISKEPTMGYVELPASENMRSDLSKRIVEIYEEDCSY